MTPHTGCRWKVPTQSLCSVMCGGALSPDVMSLPCVARSHTLHLTTFTAVSCEEGSSCEGNIKAVYYVVTFLELSQVIIKTLKKLLTPSVLGCIFILILLIICQFLQLQKFTWGLKWYRLWSLIFSPP